MNREEYLEKLRLALAQMPAEEKERQIAYYDELISDMCEDGMSETEATAKLGDPAKVAELFPETEGYEVSFLLAIGHPTDDAEPTARHYVRKSLEEFSTVL